MAILPAFAREPLARLFGRLFGWWRLLSHSQRVMFSALALTMVGSIAHFLVFSVYYIEDAGISFAYAKNFAEGEGWVTYAGGERVEGFSNPLWTWLCVLFYWLGVSPFTTAKILGALLGAATLPIAWDLARRCWPEKDDSFALFTPMFLAFSTTCAIWNASGLENGLFGFLLALGAWLVLKEGEAPRAFPWSSVAFLGLALTRPEGVLYAAVAGMVRLGLAVRARAFKPIVIWLLVFWVPLLAFEAWRYSYFAWPFPNTWYAKVNGEDRFKPWSWSTRGWLYTRNYMAAFGLAFVLPLYAIALAGLRDRRRYLVLALTVLGGVLLLWNARKGLPPTYDPDWLDKLQTYWDRIRIGFLLGSTVLLALATARGPGAAARLLMLGLGVAGLFFIHYSGSDWMTQWRFFSYVAVPNFVLLGVGLGRLLDALPEGPRFPRGLSALRLSAGVLLVLAVAAPNIWNSAWSAPTPETTVSDVKRRVEYMTWVKNRLHIDERITLWDVDMGAHMYFTDWKIMDIAGLVDVPMSRHNYQKAFIREYFFEEGKPHFAHMHGGWASKVKMTSHPEWKRDYLEIPGYPSGRKAFHIGNHIRRDIFIRPEYEGPSDRAVRYEGGITLEGWDIPSPEVPVEGKLYAEIWLKTAHKRANFRLLVVLDDGQGHQSITEVAPGYDWHRPMDWKAGEHIVNRVEIPLPASLPQGTYDIGFVLLDVKTGLVIAPDRGATSSSQVVFGPPPPAPPPDPDAVIEDPIPAAPAPALNTSDTVRAMAGEVFFSRSVTIVSREEATRLAEEDRLLALDQAAKGECEAAWEAWRQARLHVQRNTKYHEDHTPAIKGAMAACYTGRAQNAPNEEERTRLLIRALYYDHHFDVAVELARPLAQTLDLRGDEAAAKEDWEAAYQAWTTALALDPRLSFTRRKAENARDKRLGIDGKVKDGAPPTKVPGKPSTPDEDADPEAGDEDEEGAKPSPVTPAKRPASKGKLPYKAKLPPKAPANPGAPPPVP